MEVKAEDTDVVVTDGEVDKVEAGHVFTGSINGIGLKDGMVSSQFRKSSRSRKTEDKPSSEVGMSSTSNVDNVQILLSSNSLS